MRSVPSTRRSARTGRRTARCVTPAGSPGRICRACALTAVDDLLRVGARARDDDAANRLLRALDQRGHAERVADLHRRRRRRTNTGTPSLARMTTLSRSSRAAHEAHAAHDRPRAVRLRRRCRRRCCCCSPRPRRLAERESVAAQPIRVDVDLVLLDRAADRRDFGHARHGVELVPDEPVLEAAEFAERARGSRPCTRRCGRRRWRPVPASARRRPAAPSPRARGARARAPARSTDRRRLRRRRRSSRSRTRTAIARRARRRAPGG